MDGMQQPANERETVERIVHEALGRQLKVTVFLALVLGVFGFLMGHFVAASQSRETADRFREEIAALQSQITLLADRATEQEQQQTRLTMAVTDIEVLRREEAERSQTALETLAAVIEVRRQQWLRDLERYSGGRRYVPPEMVAAAVNRYVDEQLTVLSRVLDATGEGVVAAPAPPVEPMRGGMDLLTGGPPLESTDVVGLTVEGPAPEPAVAKGPSASGPELPARPDASTREGSDPEEYFAPPRRKGFLFYSPSQPREIEAVGASEPAAIPLPPL